MKTKIILSIFFFALLFVPLKAQKQLDEYLKLAAENNPGLKTKFNEYMARLEQIPQVKALPDPQLAFAWFIMPVETRLGPQEFKFTASQAFPWFGTLKIKENIALENAKSAFELFNEEKNQLFRKVRLAYYDLHFSHRSLAIQDENIKLLESYQELTLSKIGLSKASATDSYQIELELAELKNQLKNLEEDIAFQSFSFLQLLNVNDSLHISFPEEIKEIPLPYSKEAILDSIHVSNPLLKKMTRQLNALALQEDLTKKAGRPSFSIGLDYTVVGKGDANFTGTDAVVFPKIGMSIPINRKKYKSMLAEKQLLRIAMAKEQESKTNMLEMDFEEKWKEMNTANRNLTFYSAQLKLASQTLDLLKADYSVNRKGIEEIIRLERKILIYQLNKEKAKTEQLKAKASIFYLMGNSKPSFDESE